MRKLFVLLGAMALMASCQQGSTLVLNEITGKDAQGDEWVEVANASQEPLNLAGYKLVKIDKDGIDKTLYTFPDTVIAAGAVFVVNGADFKNGKGIPYKKAMAVELQDPNGKVIDSFDSKEDLGLKGHPQGSSYARIPNMTGAWALCATPTYDEPNEGVAAVEHESEVDEFDSEFEEEEPDEE